MAVQFKFRSSPKFDSVDIERRPSISVRDLKAKIIRHKNLNISQDSDLVFADASTGQEYSNESIQIPCGSSVIIKRVSAGLVHVDMPQLNSYRNLNNKDCGNLKWLIPQNVETDDFDDFGVDLYPIPEAMLSSSGVGADKNTCSPGYEPMADISRCLEPAVRGCEKLESSGISDANPGSDANGGAEQTIPRTKSEPGVQEKLNLEKMGVRDPLDIKNADFPSEMKCSVCKLFFKEAVMIPCCQHSFCDKCIRQVLVEKARCPKCFSTKCRVEDLLPNISLRRAIEHFLESQNLITVPDNSFCQYAPDGESGIQGKDVSRSGTNDHLDGETHGSTHVVPDGLTAINDYQGESMPINEEAKFESKKKRPPRVCTAGGDRSVFETGSHKKGDRTCYMCGSPDHFIRECPVASNSQSMLYAGAMSGYMPSYWNGVSLSHGPPHRNLYINHGMTPFNTMLLPPTPFSVPPYMSSMCSSIPSFGGYMTMGAVAPVCETDEDYYINRSEYPEFQGQEKRRKISKTNLRRADDDDGDWERHHYNGNKRLQEHKSCVNREKNISYSSDDYTKRPQRQHRHRDHIDDSNTHSFVGHRRSFVGHHRKEKSSSEIDDRPCSSSWDSEGDTQYHRTSRKKYERKEQCGSDCGDYCEDKHKHYHKSSRYQKERREQCGRDSNWRNRSHHQNLCEKGDKRKRFQHDFKMQKYHSNLESG